MVNLAASKTPGDPHKTACGMWRQSYQSLCLTGFALLQVFFLQGLLQAAEPWSPRNFGQPAGGDPANRKRLQVHWEAAPLRSVAARLSEQSGTTILLDRRLDPTTRIELQGQGAVAGLLGQVAAFHGWGVSSLGGVHYLGPSQSALELQTLHARAHRRVAALPRSRQRRFLAASALDWPRLSNPREVLETELSRRGLRLQSAGLVPHDLWDAMKLPKAPVTEQLTLLLVGFDLDWRPTSSGAGIEIVPLERPVTIAATHRFKSGRRISPSAFLASAPGADLKVGGGLWSLTGRVEDHRALADFLAGRTPSVTGRPAKKEAPDAMDLASKRFSLTVQEQPAGAVLRQLSKAMGLRLTAEGDQVQRLLEQRVSFSVKEATLSELLEALGKEASVRASSQGLQIVVEAATEE